MTQLEPVGAGAGAVRDALNGDSGATGRVLRSCQRRLVAAGHALAVLCAATSAAAIVISGGPTTAPPGGGSCTVSGTPNLAGGAALTCSGLNPSAVRHLYYGIRVDQVAIGDALDNTAPSGAEIFRYSSRTSTSLRYTGQTQIYNSLLPGYQVVNTELLVAFPSGTGGNFIADSATHALNSTANGDVEVLREVTNTGFSVTANVNAYNGSTWQAAGAYFDGVHTPVNDKNIDRVNLGFYYDSCGNGTREGTEQCDQGAANGTAGSCCDADCQFRPSSFVCRVGGGPPCDLSEMCTGTSATCPADDVTSHIGQTCRIGSGDACDPNEVCDGTPGVACPTDVYAPTTTICRAGGGRPNGGSECDPPEYCPGAPGVACPANYFAPSTTPCRPGSGDVCDPQEFCPGSAGGVCPVDVVSGTTTVCRPGSGDPNHSGVECDPTDYCTGVAGQACPTNVPLPPTTVCRSGSGDLCDPDEKCSGTANVPCPADVVANPSTVCRSGSGDLCDPDERCTGVARQQCPADVVQPAGTVCRPKTDPVCDIEEQCSGNVGQACPADQYTAVNTPCDVDGSSCTTDECNGTGGCVTTATLVCDDGNPCTQDSCDDLGGCVYSNGPSQECWPAAIASIKVRDAGPGPVPDKDKGDGVTFKWRGGPVFVSDMGNPTQTTRYDLCVYDDNGVKMQMTVPPGAGWTTISSASDPKGYIYKDRSAAALGVKLIKAKGSSLPRAAFTFIGKGPNLPDTSLPFNYPLTAQIYASDGKCWGAEFKQSDTRRNDAGLFKAKYRGTPAPTRTPTALPTNTQAPTSTPAVPTDTPTPAGPTNTPGGPTDTPTVTPTAVQVPSATSTPTRTPTRTSSPSPSPTATGGAAGTRIVLQPGGGATASCRGTCSGGPNPGASCASNANCGTGGTCSSVKFCDGGPYEGLRCSLDSNCNGCDPNRVCTANGAPLACCTGNATGNCPAVGSCVFVQSLTLPLKVPVNGVCVPRVAPDVPCTTDLECPSGQTCQLSELRLVQGTAGGNGEATLTVPQSSVVFNPASVAGLGTVCLTAVADGTGTVDCDGGRAGLNLTVRQDHNTTPSSAGNSGSTSGLPDDSTCTATFTQPDGSVSSACLEGTGTCGTLHPGVCNSPLQITVSGSYGSGDMLVGLPVTVTILSSSAQFGADNLACTGDDTVAPGAPATVLLSSGTTAITVYDANNSAGSTLTRGLTGASVSCAALTSGSVAGLKIGGGFPGLDQVIGDVATAFQFVAQ